MPSGTSCGTLQGGTATTLLRLGAIGLPPSRSARAVVMAVRIEKILCVVLHETHERQVEEIMETLSEGSEEFYRSHLD
jgi:hypothetical protein